jgi:(4-alkanoyl-5-oxo-2,5-dihydrofuran-3-yl)methyl phosphate reductase
LGWKDPSATQLKCWQKGRRNHVGRIGISVCREIGDRHDQSVVSQALQRADKLFLLPVLFDKSHEADRLLIEQAKQAGVSQIVKISSGAVRIETNAIGRIHREKEQLVEDSGIPWTFLRPGGFMSNTLQWAGTIKSQSKVFNPTGDGKTAPISPYDIAAVAAVALTSSGHEGRAYDLTGLWIQIRKGQGAFHSNEVARLTGCPAQTFEAWCHEHRSAFL